MPRTLAKAVAAGNKSTATKDQEELLTRLAEAGGKLTAEEDIIFTGDKIVLPASMELGDAIKFLMEKRAEDENEMTFRRQYNYRPWDGARATLRALKRAFGMVRQKGVPSFFGEIPPELITIPVGVNETDQVPWGGLAVPLMPGATLYVGERRHPEMGPLFELSCSSPRKWRHHIEGIFRLVEDELKKESLYRGKAFDGQTRPEFLDLSAVDASKVIYSEEVMTQLDANVWSLIRYSDKCRQNGVPLKRAVLFEGPYGTGKTLGAYLTAKEAVEKGWTFIYCRPGRDDLAETMQTARLYQPAVVFFEDVDSVANNGPNPQDHVAQLLDIFDGIQAKNTEILCVLTTNHVEKIHKGMVRPGRLDAVIHIGALDSRGVQRMVEALVPDKLLDADIDWDRVGTAAKDFLPAFVREAIDRTIRYNLARNHGEVTTLGTEDFVHACEGLRPQLELMEGAKEAASPDVLSQAFSNIVTDKLNHAKVLEDGEEVYRLQVDSNGASLARI